MNQLPYQHRARPTSVRLAHRAARLVKPVLLDMTIPVLDGYATSQQIKEDEAPRHVSVIMVPAVDQIESVAKRMEVRGR